MQRFETTARQPEMIPELETKLFMLVGVADGAFIIVTGIALWFVTVNPFKTCSSILGCNCQSTAEPL